MHQNNPDQTVCAEALPLPPATMKKVYDEHRVPTDCQALASMVLNYQRYFACCDDPKCLQDLHKSHFIGSFEPHWKKAYEANQELAAMLDEAAPSVATELRLAHQH